jgi:hypothetical protein
VSLVIDFIFELLIAIMGGEQKAPTRRQRVWTAVVLAALVGLLVGFVWWRNR